MIKISREIFAERIKNMKAQEVVVIFGARRVGKTYFIREYLKELNEEYVYFNGEDIQTHELLAQQSVANYKALIGTNKILYIDEAQKIVNIGSKLKLMVDEIKGLKVIVSGSSSFDILQQVGEPLTGRKKTIHMYPLSDEELSPYIQPTERQQNLEERMVYGGYPHLIHLENLGEKKAYLNDMLNSYLLKDILVYENVKNASKIYNLLKLIAFQIGGEVSIQELGKKLGISKNTADKYLDLLCKMFILHRVDGFSRNLRKEITKSSKWYFIDNGIRNAVISN